MSRFMPAEELLVLLNSNTALIFIFTAAILLKLFFSNLLNSSKLKAIYMAPFHQYQCFQIYYDLCYIYLTLISQYRYFLLVKKIILFHMERQLLRNLMQAVDFRFLYMLNDCLKGFFFSLFLDLKQERKNEELYFHYFK